MTTGGGPRDRRTGRVLAPGAGRFALLVRAAAGSALARGAPSRAAASEPCPRRRPSPTAARARPLLHLVQRVVVEPGEDRLPVVGRYSSDQTSRHDRRSRRRKAAGIDGFIVGWSSTAVLNARLAALRDVAAAENFKLAITYQGAGLPARIRCRWTGPRDLQQLRRHLRQRPGVPRARAAAGGGLVRHLELHRGASSRTITAPVPRGCWSSATEKNVPGYQRVASAVEGDLYYWSSGDPLWTPATEKLRDMPTSSGELRRLDGPRGARVRRPAASAGTASSTGATARRCAARGRPRLAPSPDTIGVISLERVQREHLHRAEP